LWCMRFVIISTSQNFTPPKKQRRRPVQVRAVMWCSPICLKRSTQRLQRSTQRQEHERLLLPVFFFSEVKPFVSQPSPDPLKI
jgi:hypothetical protein